MAFFNKTSWKFIVGFLGIVAVSIAVLAGFRYWQDYKDDQELKTLMKEIQREERQFSTTSPFELR